MPQEGAAIQYGCWCWLCKSRQHYIIPGQVPGSPSIEWDSFVGLVGDAARRCGNFVWLLVLVMQEQASL